MSAAPVAPSDLTKARKYKATRVEVGESKGEASPSKLKKGKGVSLNIAQKSPHVTAKMDHKKSDVFKRVTTFRKHTRAVYWCAWHPDDIRIATCSHDVSINVWNTSTGALTRTLKGHKNWVLQVCWTNCGDYLLSASADSTLMMWNVATSRLMHTFVGHDDFVMGLSLSPDGETMASASKDKSICFWELKKAHLLGDVRSMDSMTCRILGHPTYKDGHTDLVQRVIWHPEGGEVLTCSQDQTIRRWRSSSGKLLHTYRGHTDYVLGIAFNPKGDVFVSSSHDKLVKIWNYKSGICLHTLKGHRDIVYGCAFIPSGNGQKLVTCGHDRRIIVWDRTTGERLSMETNTHRSWVLCVAVAQDSLRFCSASGDQTMAMWVAKPPGCGGNMELVRLWRKIVRLWAKVAPCWHRGTG